MNDYRHIYQVVKFPKHYPESHIDERIRIDMDQFIAELEDVYYNIWRKFDGNNTGYQRLCTEYSMLDTDTIEIRGDEVAYMTKHTYIVK